MNGQPTDDDQFRRLEFERALVMRMETADGRNVGPFDDTVTTRLDDAQFDVPGIHRSARLAIDEAIATVRSRGRSQIVPLAGEAGNGKSHILARLRDPVRQQQQHYAFVGLPNHWAVGEFNADFPRCIVAGLVAALRQPTPTGPHRLLDRIEAIAFRAVEHLLESPDGIRHYLPRRRWWKGGPSRDQIAAACAAHDVSVFGQLDFGRFAAAVCDRYLAEPGNTTHRHVLQVLLCYVWPDAHLSPAEVRDRVAHWLEGHKQDDGFIQRRLGVSEPPATAFGAFEAAQLLMHLFSPAVSKELGLEPLAFVLCIDQSETLQVHLMPADWQRCVARLSEAYHHLPNVLILFSLTIMLWSQLHEKFEQQFQDRIRTDDRFHLGPIEADEATELYASRIRRWIADDARLSELFRDTNDPTSPLGTAVVTAPAGNESVRTAIRQYDRAFREWSRTVVVGPKFDYRFFLRECRQDEGLINEHEYTERHLDDIATLFRLAAAEMGVAARVDINEYNWDSPDPNLRALCLKISLPGDASTWGRLYVVRFGRNLTPYHQASLGLIAGKTRLRNSLARVRAGAFDRDSGKYAEQVCDYEFPPSEVSKFRALIGIMERLGQYPERERGTARDLFRDEFATTYLFQSLRRAADRLAQSVTEPGDSAKLEIPTSNP